MAQGTTDDLASATLLAANKKILVAPAMNTHMWQHPATKQNLNQIKQNGAVIIEPSAGLLACGETGSGRMAEVETIVAAVQKYLFTGPLQGVKALVTSGPTYEAIDPVRFIGNHSSGKQGHAIASALARQGADVTLISGPTALPDPKGLRTHHITSAEDMLKACEAALPAEIAICAAAVADWKVSEPTARKLKKAKGGEAPELRLIENPDILAHLSQHPNHRPSLVIGFAAETENMLGNAIEKRKRKACDWILANDVSAGKAFNAAENSVTLITATTQENWPLQSKEAIAEQLVQNIIIHRSNS